MIFFLSSLICKKKDPHLTGVSFLAIIPLQAWKAEIREEFCLPIIFYYSRIISYSYKPVKPNFRKGKRVL